MRLALQVIFLLCVNLSVAQKKQWNPFSTAGKLGFALDQINAEAMIKNGLNGEGVKIGIIDGGFLNAMDDKRLQHLFDRGKVKAYRDFVTPKMVKYGGSKHHGDDHGNAVWRMIAGFDPKTQVQFGFATESEFYLARTDDGRTDFRQEETYLIQALEWMDSLGVKLVNISIGYSTGFENPEENYKPTDMDGKTVELTKAAQIAAEKGMLLVIAGGNDGNNDFRVVSTPADARDVLTVGATALKTWQKPSYSSPGAEFLDYIKPDVVCFSTEGTSFSAPIITGLAAAIWQKKPTLTNLELKNLIIRSSHLYPYGNNYLGYGVPDAEKILNILNRGSSQEPMPLVTASKKFVLHPPFSGTNILILHKKGESNVIVQDLIKSKDRKITVKQPKGSTRTTIVDGFRVIEIVWKVP